MSYIDPKIESQFKTLSDELQNEVLRRNVKIYTLNDLIQCLEEIVAED